MKHRNKNAFFLSRSMEESNFKASENGNQCPTFGMRQFENR